mgnify:CR=1 FL=1
MQELFLFDINTSSLRQFTCSIAAILTVRRCQPDTDTALVDLEAQAAVFVIISLLAEFREFGCISQQPLLQLGIVGVDLCNGVFGIVIYLSDFLLLGKSCSHGKSSFFRKFISALEPGRLPHFPMG